MRSLDFVEKETLRRDLPPFRVGDTVRVHVKVREAEKERIQVFEGVVIRRRGGSLGETFTVRKISSGVGVERVFPIQSPAVAKVDIKSRGHVRRSRLNRITAMITLLPCTAVLSPLLPCFASTRCHIGIMPVAIVRVGHALCLA